MSKEIEIDNRLDAGCTDCDENDSARLKLRFVRTTDLKIIDKALFEGSLDDLQNDLNSYTVLCDTCHRTRWLAAQ